jgi:YVTN family beta-propeller protein
MRTSRTMGPCLALLALGLSGGAARAAYVNFESSHVHPIALTPSGGRLLVVNTPDARLEVFLVGGDGSLTRDASVPVGLEPVTVAARSETEAWVVNNLSDTVSIVDLTQRRVVRTLAVGDEPTDVVFAQNRAFVSIAAEDRVRVYDLANLAAPPVVVDLFGRKPRALAVSPAGTRVYAVAQNSGNQTTVIEANVIWGSGSNPSNIDPARLAALGLNPINCSGPHPPYPPLPPGITRNPALIDPPSGVPEVSLIVMFREGVCSGGSGPGSACTVDGDCGPGGLCGRWEDEAGQDWNNCLPFRLPDHDLFILDAANPSTGTVQTVDHLGTTLFEVSVNPATGRVYVPNTDARNLVRFEHPLGVQGHMVENRLSVVDPGAGNSVTRIDLNAHIDRNSDPALNLAERQASISQPGMMVWRSDGTTAYLTAIGSRKLFVVDGSCLAGGCIFGPSRSAPQAAILGGDLPAGPGDAPTGGPTGVALSEAKNRLYVLLRFSNSVAVVDAATLAKLDEVALHDPTPPPVRVGRPFLYDGIGTSGHGDAACSSCHLSGDMDGLAWDLGDPTGSFAPYTTGFDNVRFVIPFGNVPTPCDPAVCAAHDGFDPQKGPMATQTLRAMLEPLHWRGDRPTMRQFNKAFVGLMGTEDIGPVNGEPAGLTGPQMDLYRSFALGIRMPPNPFRRADDTFPQGCSNDPARFCSTSADCAPPGTCTPVVRPIGSPFSGNPANGQVLFNTHPSDAGQPCSACHALPFGTAGGQLGGTEPAEPTSPAATALFNGTADGSRHSDLEIPHLRNMYPKFGPVFGPPGTLSPPASKSGFGFVHDGSIPDMGTFLSANVFNLNANQVRDISIFMFLFPSGTRPAVGKQLTVPAGPAPTGSPAEEALLGILLGVGNLADPGRHCELVAAVPSPSRLRTYFLDGGGGTGGSWTTDVTGEAQVGTSALRSGAVGPLTFLCVPIGEGIRLGSDLDEDGRRNGEDCAAADPGSWAPAAEVAALVVAEGSPTHVSWLDQAPQTGPGVRYHVAGGALSVLRTSGLDAATSCLSGELAVNGFDDGRPDPSLGEGHFYLARAQNGCGSGGFGPGRAVIEDLDCP